MTRFDDWLFVSFWRMMAAVFVAAAIITIAIIAVVDRVDVKPKKARCAERGFSSTVMRGIVMCLDDQGRVIIPK